MSIETCDEAGGRRRWIAKCGAILGLLVAVVFGYAGTRLLCYLCSGAKTGIHQFEILSRETPDASKFDTLPYEHRVARLALEQGVDGSDIICVAFKCRDYAGAYICLKAEPQTAHKLRSLAEQEMLTSTGDYRQGAGGVGNMLKLNEDGTRECVPFLATADGKVYDLSKAERPPADFRCRDGVTR